MSLSIKMQNKNAPDIIWGADMKLLFWLTFVA